MSASLVTLKRAVLNPLNRHTERNPLERTGFYTHSQTTVSSKNEPDCAATSRHLRQTHSFHHDIILELRGRIFPFCFDVSSYYFHRKFVNVFHAAEQVVRCHRALIHRRCKGNIWLNIPAAAVLTFQMFDSHAQ